MYSYDRISPSSEQLKAASRRSGPPQLHYLDVWSSSKAPVCTRTGVLDYSQVEAWLNCSDEFEISNVDGTIVGEEDVVLRLVGCDFQSHPFALGCGPPVFQSIQTAFGLHESSEEAIMNNNGAFARYLVRSPGCATVDTFALVLKVANCVNIGYDALSMTYNIKTEATRAFVHGLLDHELVRLIRNLSSHQDLNFFKQPLLIPTQMYCDYRAKTEAHRILVDDSLHRTEVQIGYAVPGLLAGKPDRYTRETQAQSESIDFESITRRLHSCSTELGAIQHAGTFGKELGLFLLKTSCELDGIKPKVHDTDALRSKESLSQKVDFATNLYTSLLSQSAVLRDRVQNHINLTFSLIAQDENRISRSLARESAVVVVATKRDSTAMKTIALLTTIFLPPTFVATFFSMTMFDWSPQDEKSGVSSKYLWVYWATAIPLTAVVLLCWRVWLKLEDRKYQADLDSVRREHPIGPTAGVQLQTYEVTPTEKMRREFSQFQRRASSNYSF